MDFPQAPGSHRLLNVHQNVPGVLRDINAIISDLNANIKAQVGPLAAMPALPRLREGHPRTACNMDRRYAALSGMQLCAGGVSKGGRHSQAAAAAAFPCQCSVLGGTLPRGSSRGPVLSGGCRKCPAFCGVWTSPIAPPSSTSSSRCSACGG